MKKMTFIIFFIILILSHKTYSRESISELVCTTDKEDNNQISFIINYEKKDILFKSTNILKRDPNFKGYDYKIRQLSDDHLTAYEPRDSKSIGASIIVINRNTGRFAQSTIGNYAFTSEHPLVILSEQGFCKEIKK